MPKYRGGGEEQRGSRSREGRVQGGNEEDDLTCHESDGNAGISSVDQLIKKSFSQTARQPESVLFFNSSAVSDEQLVSLEGTLPTRDRTPTSLAASCFLSKDGCRGNARPAEGG
ncbi:hypothetical protein VZT92_014146 [Zoarces viviparus]|uniref:Uncharacterized protein n=1 Tax=Zoarces viviparus TaxID=48416 RepID=A0AAW1EZH4_ZOAVI